MLKKNEAVEVVENGANVVAVSDVGKQKGGKIVIVGEVTEDFG